MVSRFPLLPLQVKVQNEQRKEEIEKLKAEVCARQLFVMAMCSSAQ